MKEIVKLIIKYQFTIIFIILEVVSCSLIIWHNHYQRTFFSNQTHAFFNSLSWGVSSITDYFDLQQINQQLMLENVDLRNKLAAIPHYENSKLSFDTVPGEQTYVYHWARAINVSANKTKNYITINAGEADQIKQEMAVISKDGVVGIVHNTGEHFAVVLPLINVNLKLSAKIKKNDYYGSLQWDGNNYRYTYLNDIPYHVPVESGDTIITSGFSYIFPEGELIGFVESVEKDNPNFLTIKIRFAVDFKNIRDLYIIENKNREIIKSIEQVER